MRPVWRARNRHPRFSFRIPIYIRIEIWLQQKKRYPLLSVLFLFALSSGVEFHCMAGNPKRGVLASVGKRVVSQIWSASSRDRVLPAVAFRWIFLWALRIPLVSGLFRKYFPVMFPGKFWRSFLFEVYLLPLKGDLFWPLVIGDLMHFEPLFFERFFCGSICLVPEKSGRWRKLMPVLTCSIINLCSQLINHMRIYVLIFHFPLFSREPNGR